MSDEAKLDEAAKDLGLSRVLAVKALSNSVLLERLQTISDKLGYVPGWEAADNGICNASKCGGGLVEMGDPAERLAARLAKKVRETR